MKQLEVIDKITGIANNKESNRFTEIEDVFNNSSGYYDEDVREVAAWALGTFRDKDRSGSIMRILQKEEHPKVREKLVWALGQTKSRAAFAPLMTILKTDVDELEVKWAAVMAMKNLGYGDQLAPLFTKMRTLMLEKIQRNKEKEKVKPPKKMIELDIASYTSEPGKIRNVVKGLLMKNRVKSFMIYRTCMAVDEALLVTIHKEGTHNPEQRIRLAFCVEDGNFIFHIISDEVDSELVEADNNRIKELLSKPDQRALAIVSVHKIMDEISYSQTSTGESRVTLKKRLEYD